MISDKITTPTITGNCRSVPASPTDISVAYQCLIVNIKKMLNNIGQNPATITCDERIYSLMSQSIPAGYIPPGNPRENFFERANSGANPKNFPKPEETAPEACKKSLKN